MAAARYWRLVDVETYAGGDLELSEVHLYGASGRADAAATLTSTIAPASGTIGVLKDGDIGTTCRFAGSAVRSGGFALVWDFGEGATAEVIGVRIGSAANHSDFLASCTLQYSLDGAAWKWAGRLGRYAWPGPLAYTEAAPFDEHFEKVVLLLHFDGSNGSTRFVDSSLSGQIGIAKGNAKISTDVSRFGGSCAVFDGSTSWISYPESTYFGFGLDDFCVEASIYITGGQGTDRGITDFRKTNGDDKATFFIDGPAGNRLAVWYGAKIGANGVALSTNTWYHVRLSRTEGVFRCFVNGVLDWSATASIDFGASRPLGIGGGIFLNNPLFLSSPFWGYMRDLRITKFTGRGAVVFTPPSASFPDAFGSGGPTFLHPLQHNQEAVRIGVAASAPVPAHTTASAPRLQMARDVEVGGQGTIYGTTKTAGAQGAPSTPTKARVVLLQQRSKLPVREAWSDPVTGNYAFTSIDTNQQFLVLAEDAQGNFRPVAANMLTPEVQP